MRVEVQPVDAESLRFIVDSSCRSAMPDGGHLPSEDLFCRYLRRLQSRRYWCPIVTSGGVPAGSVDLEVRPGNGREALWINELSLVSAARRQGVGETLVRHALVFASSHGWTEVHATTELDNPGGLATLARSGFVVVSLSPTRCC